MRRRWPVLAATIPLVFGSVLATAYPAAASTGDPGPGRAGAARRPDQPAESGGRPDPRWRGAGRVVTPQISGGQSQITSGGRNTVVTSSNWAGYAATGTHGFTSVSANWTQPTGHCTGGNQYAAFWVGLDGYSSSTVEQTGSEVDCAGRTPQYYAWYEIYPGASMTFTNPVRAGDQFSGSVTYGQQARSRSSSRTRRRAGPRRKPPPRPERRGPRPRPSPRRPAAPIAAAPCR